MCVSIDLSFQEVSGFHGVDQLNEFMLGHGENIVDIMGDEIDRIEMNLSVSKSNTILYSKSIFRLQTISPFLIDHVTRSREHNQANIQELETPRKNSFFIHKNISLFSY